MLSRESRKEVENINESVHKKLKSTTIALAIVLLLALILRFVGTGFGLPYEFHVDEVQYVRQAARMGTTGLAPTWWNNPPLFKYLLFLEYALLYLLGHLIGIYSSTADFGAKLNYDPTLLYLLGRFTSALFGTLTVLVTFWIGKLAYNLRIGLISSLFLAVCFMAVRDSHFAVNDTAVTLLISFALLASIQILKTGKTTWYIVAGIALGMGIATKYSAIYAVVPIVTAHALYACDQKVKFFKWTILNKLIVVTLVSIITALIVSPFFIFSFQNVVRDVYESLYLAGRQGFEGWQISSAGAFTYYLHSLNWGLGSALFLLVCAGLIAALILHTPSDIILALTIIIPFLAISSQKMYFARFLLPLVPPLLVIGGRLLDWFIQRFSPTQSQINKVYAFSLLPLTLQPMASSIRFDQILSRTDTRTIAKQWIEENIPAGARIAVDWPFHSIPLSTPDKSIPFSSRPYDVLVVGGKGLSDHNLDWYQRNGFQYLITTSHIVNLRLSDLEKDRLKTGFYEQLDDEIGVNYLIHPASSEEEIPFIFEELYGPAVSIWKRNLPGPIIRIYSLEKAK